MAAKCGSSFCWWFYKLNVVCIEKANVIKKKKIIYVKNLALSNSLQHCDSM